MKKTIIIQCLLLIFIIGCSFGELNGQTNSKKEIHIEDKNEIELKNASKDVDTPQDNVEVIPSQEAVQTTDEASNDLENTPQDAVVVHVIPGQEPVQTINKEVSKTLETDKVVVIEDDGSFFSMVGSSGKDIFVDIPKVTNKFYSMGYEDNYDFIAVFTDFPSSYNGAYLVSRNIKGIGIGLEEVDNTNNYGSKGRLKTVSYLSNSVYDLQDNKLYYGTWVPSDSLLATLLHEIGHHWCCYAGKQLGMVHTSNLAAGHWRISAGHPRDEKDESASLDTDGDVLGGIDVINNNDDTVTFVDVSGVSGFHKFHPFTLYLMGLIPKEEVNPILYFESIDGKSFISLFGYQGSSVIEVKKKWITIDDLINVEGERIPDFSSSQKDFRMAVILVIEKGNEVSPEAIKIMNEIADKFPDWWNRATDGRSTMSTNLN